jgi:hypothetical protein
VSHGKNRYERTQACGFKEISILEKIAICILPRLAWIQDAQSTFFTKSLFDGFYKVCTITTAMVREIIAQQFFCILERKIWNE